MTFKIGVEGGRSLVVREVPQILDRFFKCQCIVPYNPDLLGRDFERTEVRTREFKVNANNDGSVEHINILKS